LETERFIKISEKISEGHMKPGHLLVAVATITVFLATFFVANGVPTGFLTAFEQPINLEVGNVQVHDTTAVISWSTDVKTYSVLTVNDEQTAFSESRTFSKALTGLAPGTEYEYKIRACDDKACDEYSSSIATSTNKVEPQASLITGAVTGIDGIVTILQTSINSVLYALLALIVLVITTKIGYEKFSNKDPVSGMISKTNQLIESERYDEAHELYANARQAFSELEEEAKLKNYDGLLKIYHNLRKNVELREAQRLAEKYSDGTITQEELNTLNDLIVR